MDAHNRWLSNRVMSVFLVTGGAVLHFSASCAVSVGAAVAMSLVLDGSRSLRALIPLLWAGSLAAMPLLLDYNLLNHGWLCTLAPAGVSAWALSVRTQCVVAQCRHARL